MREGERAADRSENLVVSDPPRICRFSLVEFMTADEVFTTGTMGELTPVYEIDGRTIADGKGAGPVTKRLQEVYKDCPEREGWSTPIPEFV